MDKHSHKQQPIILAASGTGGHLYPALAVYQALKEQGIPARLFTDQRGLRFATGFDECDIDVVPSGGLVSGSPIKRLRGLWQLFQGWQMCRRLVRRYNAVGVIGFGGYGAVPPIIAASQLGVPSLLYQGDAVLGRANAFVAGRVASLCLSFPQTAKIPDKARTKITVVGAPMRAEIEALHAHDYNGPDHQSINLLCVGGSLGAKVFAQLLPKALGNLGPDKRAGMRLVQQVTDPDDLSRLTQTYRDMGLNAQVLDYIHDMDKQLQKADVIIARSGGTTVHECAAAGRAAIFVPLGLHADGQQTHNAQYLQQAGAAWIVPDNDSAASGLAEILRNIVEKPTQLSHKAGLAKSKAILGAANSIVALAKTEFGLK